MKKKEIKINYLEVGSLEKLDDKEQYLVSKAKAAAGKAYAPYSGFHVGAAVLLENGEIFTGSNQENVAFPSGLCAERTAIFAASAQFPEVPARTIVITALNKGHYISNPLAPCGACRQVLLQSQIRHNNNLKIILFAESKSYIFDDVVSLLPLPFDEF